MSYLPILRYVLTAVVHRIFEEAYEHLNEGGSLWIVIQKKQGAPSAAAKLESLFTVVEEVGKDKGYRIIRAQKIVDYSLTCDIDSGIIIKCQY